MRTFRNLLEPFWNRTFSDNPSSPFTSGGGDIPIAALYDLYDKFTTARAAGSVNGTLAEPVGGVRTVNDTENKLSLSGGAVSIAGGITVNEWGDPSITLPITARILGKSLLCEVLAVSGVTGGAFGFATVQDIANNSALIRGAINIRPDGTTLYCIDSSSILVGTIAASILYRLCITLRAAGAFHFIKGGTFSNWTMLYITRVDTTASLYPGLYVRNGVSTADNIRVPKRTFIPVPLQSDGFSGATTDGAGNAENNGPVGNAYTNVGTWGVAAGVRSCSVLSGGLGFSLLPCSSSNVIIDAVCTRSAGVTGIAARYASATDYLIAYLDGTNAKLDKVVAGVATNLISAAVTYGAAFVLRLILDGATARLFYNNLAVGAVAVTPAAGALDHGLYTTDVGATFDNLAVWARGNENQYSPLDTM